MRRTRAARASLLPGAYWEENAGAGQDQQAKVTPSACPRPAALGRLPTGHRGTGLMCVPC